MVDSIPWLVTSDLHVVSLVSSAGDGTQTKELMTIADLCCWITRTRGATEAVMLDHDMAPLTEDLFGFKQCSNTPTFEETKRDQNRRDHRAIDSSRHLDRMDHLALPQRHSDTLSHRGQKSIASSRRSWRMIHLRLGTPSLVPSSTTSSSCPHLQVLASSERHLLGKWANK